MPNREADPIARMPISKYCPQYGQMRLVDCDIIRRFVTPTMDFPSIGVVDMLMAGAQRFSFEKDNKIHTQWITRLRDLITRHAQERGVDLYAVAQGQPGHHLDDVLQRDFCTLHWQSTELTLKNLWLVPEVFLHMVPGVALMDMERAENVFQAGLLGLYDASRRLHREEFSREVQFSTYAIPYIHGVMTHEVRVQLSDLHTGLTTYTLYRKIQDYYRQMYSYSMSHDEIVFVLRGIWRSKRLQENITYPEPEEVHHGLSQLMSGEGRTWGFREQSVAVETLLALVSPTSLDHPNETMRRHPQTGEWEAVALPFEESIPNMDISVEEAVMIREQNQAIWLEFGRLAEKFPRRARAIDLRFGLTDGKERGFRDIGDAMDVTYQAAQALFARTMWHLGHSSGTRKRLQEFRNNQ